MLPSDAKDRKAVPVATGVIDYFPDALAAVAEVSYCGNEQHNPGSPLHWDRSKSTDEADALMRHFMERGKLDTDGKRHSAKVAWRALALLQKEIENEIIVPLAFTAAEYVKYAAFGSVGIVFPNRRGISVDRRMFWYTDCDDIRRRARGRRASDRGVAWA